MKLSNGILGVLILAIALAIMPACQKSYTPKPKAYPRIIFPEKGYQQYSSPYCPFTFEYPTYAEVVRDSFFFQEFVENPCWLNLQIPQFSGSIHITYKEIEDGETFANLIEDAHKLTFKHTSKADYIEEYEVNNEYGVQGILYEVGGNAATPVQYFITDEENHFLRAALYFNVAPNVDSMGPVINFIYADMEHMLETFRWE